MASTPTVLATATSTSTSTSTSATIPTPTSVRSSQEQECLDILQQEMSWDDDDDDDDDLADNDDDDGHNTGDYVPVAATAPAAYGAIDDGKKPLDDGENDVVQTTKMDDPEAATSNTPITTTDTDTAAPSWFRLDGSNNNNNITDATTIPRNDDEEVLLGNDEDGEMDDGDNNNGDDRILSSRSCFSFCCCSFNDNLILFSKKRKLYPLLFLTIIVVFLWPAGGIALKELMAHTDSTFKHGIPNSLSAIAQDAFIKKLYPKEETANTHPSILIVLSIIIKKKKTTTTQNHSSIPASSLIHNTYAETTSLALQPYLEDLLGIDKKSTTTNTTTTNSTNTNTTTPQQLLHVTSFYSYRRDNLTLLGRPYMSKDYQTTVIQIDFSVPQNDNDTKKRATITTLMEGLDQFYHVDYPQNTTQQQQQNTTTTTTTTTSTPFLEIGMTGLDYFSQDLRKTTHHDLQRMDVIVLPLALWLVGWTIQPKKAWLIWIIPFFGMISTVCVWSIVTFHIWMKHYHIQITQFTPSIMMSLTLGMGMDYSLFLLARYYHHQHYYYYNDQKMRNRNSDNHNSNNHHHHCSNQRQQQEQRQQRQEQRRQQYKFKAIDNMLRHAGKVVIVSGMTLVCTFLGLVALPLGMLQSVGLGAATAIASAIMMNLLVVPALLCTQLGDWIIDDDVDDEGHNDEDAGAGADNDDNNDDNHNTETTSATATSESTTTTTTSEAEETSPSRGNHNDEVANCETSLREPLLLVVEPGDAVAAVAVTDDDDPSSTINTTTTTTTVVVLPTNGDEHSSIWIRLSRHLLHPYKSIIIMLLLIQFLLWPLGRNALRLESSSIAFESLLPTNSASMKAYKRLATGLGGPGKMAPFRILVDGTAHNVSMDSKEGFDILHYLVQELLRPKNGMSSYYDTFEEEEEELTGEETSGWIQNIDLNNGTEQTALKSRSLAARHYDPDGVIMLDTIPKATYTGISVLENIQIPYAIYVASKICAGSNHSCPVEAMRALNVLDDRVTSTDRMATYIMVELSVSPFSDDGIRWLDETRRRIANLTDKKDNSTTTTATHHMICKNKVDIYVDGSAAIAHDAVQAVYGSFPWVIGISLGIVFCLLGLYFGSIVPPLRSVVSISCTLAVSFGSAVLVYQDGIFSGSHFRSLMAMDPELCWLVPIMSFSIMVGLALDYDVFLVSRIYEFRSLEGYQHQSSIVAGLDATGGIITAAGVIMAISFGSLLWSASPALDQWAFLVTTAVLLDTFVVRTVVVPILIGWTGDQYSWYPCRFEKGTTKLDGFDIIDTTSPPGESNPRETTLAVSTSSSQERDQDLEQSTST